MMTVTEAETVSQLGEFVPAYLGATLGELVIMSIKESTRVPFADLKEMWEIHGVAGPKIPDSANPKDAFRGATPKGVRDGLMSFMPYEGQARLEYMADACVLVESQDEESRVDKRHRNLGVVVLTKSNEIVFESDLKTSPSIEWQIEQIRMRFNRNLVSANARQIRGMVQRALELSSKVTYHDGVYLIPRTRIEMLDGLGTFVQWLNAYSGTDAQKWIRLPYADTPTQRADLKTMLDMEIKTNVEQIINAAQDHMQTSKDPHRVTKAGNKGLTLLTELTLLDARLHDYKTVLSDRLIDIDLYLGAKVALVKGILQMPDGQRSGI